MFFTDLHFQMGWKLAEYEAAWSWLGTDMIFVKTFTRAEFLGHIFYIKRCKRANSRQNNVYASKCQKFPNIFTSMCKFTPYLYSLHNMCQLNLLLHIFLVAYDY